MLGFSWGEIMVIGAVALVVIGPKDLPELLRTVGRWTGAARKMAREFQGHVDDMIRDSEVDKVRDSIRENMAGNLDDLANNIDPDRTLRDAADPTRYLPDGGLGDAGSPDAPPVAPPAAAAADAAPPAPPTDTALAAPEPAAKPANG